MKLGQFELLAQLGAGTDGIAYRARDARDDRAAEVRVLEGARADADRWPALVKRLRLAALLQDPAAWAVRELALEEGPPYLALAGIGETTLAGDGTIRVPPPIAQTLAHVRALAQALAEAHRLGLIHGRLDPAVVRADAGKLQIDFTGLEVHSPTKVVACFRAPECSGGDGFEPASDVYSLGALLAWLLTGEAVPEEAAGDSAAREAWLRHAPALGELPPELLASIARLLNDLLASDPDARPPARIVEQRLEGLLAALGPANDTGSPVEALTRDLASTRAVSAAGDWLLGEQLGRFRLIEKLGQGGMGAVYRAKDATDGATVAVKVLRADLAQNPQALQRLQKEARLLARVNNPYVANLLEVNEDKGVHYLAIEFVAGRNVRSLLDKGRQLDEPTALAILSDVARALLDAHERGIVHRDIKPDNILLVGELPAAGTALPRAKLLDFGLARQVEQSQSLQVTRAGDAVGTPLYMAPEQCTGQGNVSPRTDVYAMGATLFHMLAGRPPFVGEDVVGTFLMHCSDPVPPLKQFNPQVSDGVCQVVEKALAKAPDARYADAAALLHDLQRLLRGEPTSITVHPRLPACDPRRVWQFDWTWELEASPAQLWPFVSNTERLNRAVGLPDVQFTARVDAGNRVQRYGQFRKAGVVNAWQEHPFEWIEGRRMGVLREYQRGVFKWLLSVVELTPRPGGGTTLTHRVRLEPRGLLGRLVAALEVGVKGRRGVERVYHRIDAALVGKLTGGATVDAFEGPARLAGAAQRRLERLLRELGACGVDPAISERLGDYLTEAPDQEVARIRPLALARRLALDPDQFVTACLYAAQKGLLVLLWDILCPVCRIPTQVTDTLKALREHGRCEACNLDFELDFANSVEMIFRVHPEIRPSELRTYCVGGPAHSPHVVSQARLAPGERLEMDLSLAEGAYRFRGPQLPYAIDFRVSPRAGAGRWDLNLSRPPGPDLPRTLKTGSQLLAFTNDHDTELVVRVERTAPRGDAITAGRAWSLALFRQLYPGEILASGQLISVATMTLLTTRLDGVASLYHELGDVRASALIHEHFRLLEEHVRREGGALVKTNNAGFLAVFHDTAAAVGAALEMQPLLQRTPATQALRIGVGIHRGPAVAATLNDHLDYLGTVVDLCTELAQRAGGDEVLLSQTVAGDPQVDVLLRQRHLSGALQTIDLPGWPNFALHRLAVVEAVAGKLPPANGEATAAAPDPGRARRAVEAYSRQVLRNPVLDQTGFGPLKKKLLQPALEFCQEVIQQLAQGPEADAERASAQRLLADLAGKVDSATEPLALYQSAAADFEQLVREQPDQSDYCHALAVTYNNLGARYRAAGKRAEARTALDKAVAQFEELGRRYPTERVRFLLGLGAVRHNLGHLHQDNGDTAAALADHTRAVAILETVRRESPHHAQAPRYLQAAYQARAMVQGLVGQHAEALRDWERALAVDPKQPLLRLGRALALVRLGEHGRGTAEARAVAEQPPVRGRHLHSIAQVHSLAAELVRRDSRLPAPARQCLTAQYVEWGVEFLRKAQAAGYFQTPGRREALQTAPDFSSLRQHPGFVQLRQGVGERIL